ncbi:DsbA family protein [Primorskyibacter sp. S87]|uniref:DsbA family protein n=1 Tax=Primorskyibacter sp. S87 TaxID=3415126 RepID=UPI003C7E6E5D
MIRFAAPALTAMALLAAPAQALDLSNMNEDERSAFRAEIRSYLLENPEVIIEAIDILEQQRAEAEAQADYALVAHNADELFNDGYSWVGGNPDGDITLVEFMDYRCGYCRKAVPEVAKVLKEDGNIRLIIKEYPILGEASVLSARFAVATLKVAGNDAYKQVHDALLEYSGEVNEVSLRRISEGLGLETDKIFETMPSAEVTEDLTRTAQLAQRMNISGTPTFVLDDELLRGYLPAEQMLIMVDDKRDKG